MTPDWLMRLPSISSTGRLAHLVDLAPIALAPRLALEEIDEDRFPWEAGEGQHEGDLVAIAGLGEAVQADTCDFPFRDPGA